MNNLEFGKMRLSKIIAMAGFAATICVVAMFGVFLATKIGQDPLQYIHSPFDYRAILINSPQILKATIGIDNLFIICYSTLFLATGSLLWGRVSSKLILGLGIGLMLATAFFDVFENMHFLTMIGAAANGFEIGMSQIELQVWQSMVKFHLSYLGLFLFGLCLPRETKLEKALCFSLIYLQAPIGILIYTAPQAFAVPLVMVRFVFFMFSLFSTALVFQARKFD